MLLITPAQVRRLRRIIAAHHDAFVVEMFGVGASGLEEDEVQALVNLGFLSEEAADGLIEDPVGDSFLTGMLVARLWDLAMVDALQPGPGAAAPDPRPDDPAARLTYQDVADELARDPIPVGPVERLAMESARRDAGQYCRGLGNRVSEDLETIAIEADDEQRARLQGLIADETEIAIARRSTVDHLRSEIGHRTGDWSRDLERIAATELQNAYSNGKAAYVEDEHGADARVVKIPNSDACRQCKAHYLEPDGRSRIFLLSELRANGSNVGRKVGDWKPTVEALHPWCHCAGPMVVPDGYGFDAGGRLVHLSQLRGGGRSEEEPGAQTGAAEEPAPEA